jgi:hypothetical protein
MRNQQRVEVVLGIVTSLSGLAALAYMLYAPRVPIISVAPLRDGSISQAVHYISMTDLTTPSMLWWGAALAVALVAVGVGVAAGFHARTGQRVPRSILAALAVLFLLALFVLSNQDLGFFNSGPVYLLPSLALTLVCTALAFLPTPAARSAQG